jgi:diguanylate cyclase (GGDEF)-like protein
MAPSQPLSPGRPSGIALAAGVLFPLALASAALVVAVALVSGGAGVSAIVAGLAGVVALLLLAALLLRSLASAPLRALAGAIEQVRSGDDAARAPVKGAREVRRAAATFNEVAARFAELTQAIGTDPVTGLLSFQRFQQAVDVEVKRAAREMAPMALILIDVDNFKAINDAHGRQDGDRVLRGIADRLQASLRATDVLARIAGDDFALLLPKASADHAEMVLSRSRDALADVEVEGFTLSVAAGYACYPADARDAATLMQAAEGALRMAQRRGSGSTLRYDPSEVSVSHTEGERHEVFELIDAPEGITPVFQPLVALATGQVSGYEALTRFNAPPKRRPDEWFLLAQRVGLGPALEARAIEAALAVPGRPPGAYLSLNLSPSTLAAPEVQAVLPEDLSGLVIELTEHELAADDSILDADVASLRERGARVAVDDAGAGYAGLQQLMRVQPDLIKLDRSLVSDVDSDLAKQALVDAFVRFGRRTGAQVVAEGIETEEELRTLADLDVSYGQGFFLAKPGPPWPTISPWISEKLLRRSLGGALAVEDLTQLPVGSDQRLAAVCARISRLATLSELERLQPAIAEELGADDVVVLMRSSFDGALSAINTRAWLPSAGRLDLGHFPELEGVLRRGEPEQILLEHGMGPTAGMGTFAMLANSGFRSMLAVPIGGDAMLQAFAEVERPWGRAQTNRALVIAYQLAPVLAAIKSHAPAASA